MNNSSQAKIDNTCLCCFSEAIVTRACACPKATKYASGYRRRVACRDPVAQAACSEWIHLIRRAAKFSMGHSRSPAALPRNLALKLQCGGLEGLRQTIDPNESNKVIDVCALIKRAASRFGKVGEIPMAGIVRAIHAYKSERF